MGRQYRISGLPPRSSSMGHGRALETWRACRERHQLGKGVPGKGVSTAAASAEAELDIMAGVKVTTFKLHL